ncbi:uncharacterized protein ColSpa_09688 [Colletotrichum spaethianum]|uniref:Uncharacterized protein n=1 Tax=Colletotrichum spaethianum TaxID=700344 RepID=A0AA37PC61_9PEZI|nr:uncharacterized protein ColSpa_09688 [Colletotrichum spaethianum]GKT49507.1 hypothetical protein ColSpa_09688 [Colletotrichum spaethianum]
MDISKFTAAAASQTNEFQVALASLNLDFSLFKVEAPQEYKAVGKHISSSRKQNAEEGPAHRTARKLDTLIGSMITSPELLVKAYGQRVSEISSSTAFNPRGSQKDGLFKEHVGADSTTIWAAATSGKGALAVHLLACMLARLWTPAEATSIWAEIVQRRKAQITAEYDTNEPSHFPLIQASRLEISRSELANWDAGARAWLTVADNAMLRQHTQLRLITENLSISVNNKLDVFSGVIDAWKTGMQTVEHLLQGIAQRVDNGAILLALSAWHIYPDMIVFGDRNKTIKQHDNLITKGGCLTIGLEDADQSQSKGVYWSLSLAHLRFYGDPIICQRSAAEDASRVTFNEFTLVALGCFLQKWCAWTQHGLEIPSVTNLIIALGRFVSRISGEFKSNPTMTIQEALPAYNLTLAASGWIGVLAKACEMLEESNQIKEYQNLVKLGTRRGSSFLSPATGHPPRLFGLTSPEIVLNMLKSTSHVQLKALRVLVSADKHLRNKNLFIKYRQGFGSNKWYEFATLTPIRNNSKTKDYVRWVPLHLPADTAGKRLQEIASLGEVCERYNPDSILSFDDGIKFLTRSSGTRTWDDVAPMSLALTNDEAYEHKSNSGTVTQIRIRNLGRGWPVSLFTMDSDLKQIDMDISPNHLIRFLDERLFDVAKLENHLTHSWFEKSSPAYIRCMKALASANTIYGSLPGATVSLSVLRRELGKQKWVPKDSTSDSMCDEDEDDDFVMIKRRHRFFEGYEVDRAHGLSCVAFFETGSLDLSPDSFDNVLAISSGNSIFASKSILCDPWENPEPYKLQRLTANIGRPGLSLLIPPINPKMRQPEFDSWKVVNHEPFDGGSKDHFSNTSIHLSFTKYESPVPGAVHHGAQDVEATYVETLAQVHEGPKWVADVDILAALQSSLLKRVAFPNECEGHVIRHKPRFPAASIDNWEEMIDSPGTAGVVRAEDNFVARLAAAAVSVQQGKLTFILPRQLCWKCIENDTWHTQDDLAGGTFIW